MGTLTVVTLVLLFDHIDLDATELYILYVENQLELYEGNPPTKNELFLLTIVFRVVIFAVFPAAILIYRGRLLSMVAFMNIKMHQGRRKGLAYSQTIELMNYFYLWSKLRGLNYIQYITFK